MIVSNCELPKTATEAVEMQKKLRSELRLEGQLNKVDLVAGVDVSSYAGMSTLVGAVAVWSISETRIVDSAIAASRAIFPYIPGLLAFRELPVLLEALSKLSTAPEAILVDGQGTAHMRGMGIACHLGLCVDVPVAGCGKSRLVGSYEEPAAAKGSQSVLTYKGEEVGRVVRTRDNVKPVFVSAGNRISQDSAYELVVGNCSKFRLPDSIRAAHNLAREKMKRIIAGR